MATKTVEIIVNTGGMSYSPALVEFQPGDTIQWHLNSDSGWSFDDPGIVIATDPDPSHNYAGWPVDDPATQVDASTWSVIAPPNELITRFRYTINSMNVGAGLRVSWDPEMENNPGG